MDIKLLDKILSETVLVIEQSKGRIFDIAETSRTEYQRIEQQWREVRAQTTKCIAQVDAMERDYRYRRLRLMDVSRDFKRFSEADIKAAYEDAQKSQVDLVMLREREQYLRVQRDDLERSLRALQDTVKKAEELVSQVGMAMELLKGNIRELSGQLDSMHQRQALGLRVIKAQEEERRRVARDIHDGPAQTLANVMLRAEICEKLLESDVTQVRAELRLLKSVVRTSLQDIRKVIYDLRPMALDDLGLVPTLRRYINDLKERHTMLIDFSVLGLDRRLPSHIEVGGFRIVQESLNNAFKHSCAVKVVVRVEFAEDNLGIFVQDDGQGFVVEEAINRQGDHFGLLSMRERVEVLQGSWQLSSSPGMGTTITVRIPIREEVK
ncbi:MAG: Signal transduction histidine-protein kinase/phosphatase DegS [Firmicutes bacterium]|nr:Signal transduction histidine-protein kinase/phosphatase DegS [Bacillota bacterium]